MTTTYGQACTKSTKIQHVYHRFNLLYRMFPKVQDFERSPKYLQFLWFFAQQGSIGTIELSPGANLGTNICTKPGMPSSMISTTYNMARGLLYERQTELKEPRKKSEKHLTSSKSYTLLSPRKAKKDKEKPRGQEKIS